MHFTQQKQNAVVVVKHFTECFTTLFINNHENILKPMFIESIEHVANLKIYYIALIFTVYLHIVSNT